MKIENFNDLIVKFGFLIEEALELGLDDISSFQDVHDAFETAFDEAVQVELEGR